MYIIKTVKTAFVENGNKMYLTQLKSYLRGEDKIKQNKYQGDNDIQQSK